MALRLDSNLQYLKGVGPKLASVFAKRGLHTMLDLLEFYPRAYEDRRAARSISSLQADEIVSLKGIILSVQSIPLGKTSRKIYDVSIRDGSGIIHCKFFRVPYKGYFERFAVNKEVRVVGKVTLYRGRLEFHHPELKDIEPDEEDQDILNPIYTEIEGLSSAKIQKMIQLAIHQLSENLDEADKLPAWLKQKYEVISKKKAFVEIHKPPLEKANTFLDFKSEAHRRLIFEEFFWLETYLAAKKTGFQKEKSRALVGDNRLCDLILQNLPFALTNAQKRSIAEISTDLKAGYPMHRLVQGDVGSGKTLVSFLAAAQAIEANAQVCLMVPTEILAEQHLKNAQKVLEPAGVRLALLTGRTKASEREQILRKLKQHELDLVIGTHALIEDDVEFSELGLVIIDEQHRFGVEQRGKLKSKGISPHFLVMTATPIPRTLAMTVYGDLDVSIIDEMPPGRTAIQTRVVRENKKPQVLQFMVDQIAKGRQAYVVYPLVEESEKIDLKDAVSEFEKLQAQFPNIKFGLLHGKLKPAEKEEVMSQFRQNHIQVLVSTTVIEVGVDVPNANLMIIEHAERFGLSQLHQLRGRVGRGEFKSFCVLVMAYAVSEEGKQRTEMMEKTSDGFKIAEFDLQLRGPGEFLGTKQSGLPGFKLANLVRDMAVLHEARAAAFELLKKDPQLKKPENAGVREELLRSHGPGALAAIG